MSMKVLAENYKGIEYVRISKLPEAQKAILAAALPSDHIIKILRENELLTDCVQFKHYEAWYNTLYNNEPTQAPVKIQKQVTYSNGDQSHTPSGTISRTLPAGSSK